MPRTYKRRLGSREYRNYTESVLDEAITEVVEGRLSIRRASEKYDIPYGTLHNKYHGKYGKKPGAQPAFTRNEETKILESAAKSAEWGFPLSLLDLRMFAKMLLDKQGRSLAKFPNNLPGVDWAYSLLKRHKTEYSRRVATNIKKARAAVSRTSLGEYFDNLEQVVKDVPPANIFNYDESNVSDDPGKKIGTYKRRVKYPEKAMNFSKSATSIMVCGSADGCLLPPYIIYKSVHLYDTWKERAPAGPPCCDQPCCSKGSRFNRTISGWIDGPTFRDWFTTAFLPHAKRLTGRKVLLGDNLSSHIDDEVLRLCSENNIDFVCLVPNSTHLTQPLDVAFFRPMKSAWRQTLTAWKIQNSRLAAVPKDTFPHLLTKALDKMDKVQPKPNTPYSDITSGIKRNLMSGFNATGVYPFSKNKVLDKLPSEDDVSSQEVESTLTAFLKEARYGNNSNQQIRKKKRLDVAPGKSISTRNGDMRTPSPQPGTSSQDDSQLDPIEVDMDQTELSNQNNQEDKDNQSNVDDNLAEEDEESECTHGRFVLVKFFTTRGKETYKYVCQIIQTDPLLVEGYKAVQNSKTFKRIPNDISEIDRCDIIAFLPKPVEKGDQFEFQFEINIKELKKSK